MERGGSEHSLPSQFIDDLNQIWDEVGIGAAERVEILDKAERRVRDFLSEAVERERANLSRLRIQVAELHDEVDSLSNNVSSPWDGLAKERNMSLTKRLEILLSEKSRLQAIATELKISTEQARDELIFTWVNVLGEPRESLTLPEARKLYLMKEIYRREQERLQGIVNDRKAEVHRQLHNIRNLLKILGWTTGKAYNEVDEAALADTTTRVDAEFRNKVRKRLKEVEEEEIRRKIQLAKLVKVAFDLHATLGTATDESAQFMELHSNVSDESISAWQTEIKRLKELESKTVEVMVETLQERLNNLWKELSVFPSQRGDYKPSPGDIPAQKKTAASMKAEVVRLERAKELAEPIKHMLQTRSELREKKITLERDADNPQRLLERKRTEPGLLLKEEKLRREISVLPKVEAKILNAVANYSAEVGIDFVIGDELAEHVLKRDQAMDEALREEKRMKRLTDRSKGISSSRNVGTPSTPKAPRTPRTNVQRSRFLASTESSTRKKNVAPPAGGSKPNLDVPPVARKLATIQIDEFETSSGNLEYMSSLGEGRSASDALDENLPPPSDVADESRLTA